MVRYICYNLVESISSEANCWPGLSLLEFSRSWPHQTQSPLIRYGSSLHFPANKKSRSQKDSFSTYFLSILLFPRTLALHIAMVTFNSFLDRRKYCSDLCHIPCHLNTPFLASHCSIILSFFVSGTELLYRAQSWESQLTFWTQPEASLHTFFILD